MISFKKATVFTLLSIATIFTLGNSVTFANVAEDSAITLDIQKKLKTEGDMPQNLSVSTKDGVVNLKGEVETSSQAGRAVEIALGTENVVEVQDADLKVKDSKVILTDTFITARVKVLISQLNFKKQIVEGNELHVETTNQVVHITGKVARAADTDTVVEAVKKVKNVKSVKTNITN